jgi:hypothetical protein
MVLTLFLAQLPLPAVGVGVLIEMALPLRLVSLAGQAVVADQIM